MSCGVKGRSAIVYLHFRQYQQEALVLKVFVGQAHAAQQLGARLLDQCITLPSGDDLSRKSRREALRFFVLFHKQHIWLVHTDRALAFFVGGVGSQGNEHVPSGQSAEPEHRIGHPT